MSVTNYYPGGMMMPGRKYSFEGNYRYGFNGQEKSNEIQGEGNSYTAEFWEYDPRLVRRWNVDPRPNPSISVYNAFAGNPICLKDPFGDTTFLYDKKGRHIETINDNLPNQVHYLSKAQQVKYKIQKILDKDRTSIALYARSISTAFIGENTISQMKNIAKEGGDINEVGFVGIVTKSREIHLKSLGTKYSTRDAGGWSYDMETAVKDFTAANPDTKIFLTGHYHPWAKGAPTSGENSDGVKRSGNWYKFFAQKPTERKLADYRPLLTNPLNFAVWEDQFGETQADFTRKLKGPHPLLIVTSFGYITYGSGKNTVIDAGSPEYFDYESVKKVEFNSNYFHKY